MILLRRGEVFKERKGILNDAVTDTWVGQLRKATRHLIWAGCILTTAITFVTSGTTLSSPSSSANKYQNSISLPAHSLGKQVNADLRIAFLSDVHIDESRSSLARLELVVSEILENKPDLILLAGDFVSTANSEGVERELRIQFLKTVEQLTHHQAYAVLGNHEHWGNAGDWVTRLNEAGIKTLDNATKVVRTQGTSICLRGLGDYYSGKYRKIEFPEPCQGLPRVTFTHDPAAAFQPGVEGLILAGHTHCGQVSIPFVGPLWAPTEAPREAWCGLYQDELRTLWTSSGVGTSILPIRLGAPSQWDLIEIGPR